MKSSLRSESLVKAIDRWGTPGIALYVFCMFFYPWWDGAGSWEYVQRVWDRWQTLNAGLLAFLASIVALRVSRLAEHRAEERNFRAARAMLPAAFSELQEYLRECAAVLSDAWDGAPDPASIPSSPIAAKDILRDCIKFSESEIGDYLAEILVLLQVHEVRLGELGKKNADVAVAHYNLVPYIAAAGRMHALLDKQFEFARGEAEFDTKPLSWEEVLNSYKIMRIEVDTFVVSENFTLERHTKSVLEKQ